MILITTVVNLLILISLYLQQWVQASDLYHTQTHLNTWQVAAVEYCLILTEVRVLCFQEYNRMHL